MQVGIVWYATAEVLRLRGGGKDSKPVRKQKPAAPVKAKANAKASAEDADPARVIRKAATEALRLITLATNNYKVMESICKEIGAVVNPRAVKWLET